MATEGTRKRRRRNTKSTAAATASTSTTATSAEGVSAPPTATAQSPLPTQPTQSTQPSQPQRKRPRSSPANTEQSLPSPPPAPLPEEKDDEEKALESFLFGGMLHADELPFGEEEATERADGQAAAVSGGGGGDVESLFVIDRKGASAVSDTTTTTSSAAVADGDSSVPVWHDPDDQQQMIDLAAQPRLRKLRTSDSEQRITAADYQQRLRQTYTNLNHAASWVKAKRATADTQHDEAMWDVLRTSRSIRQRDTAALPSGHLDIQALKDANAQQPAQGVIHAVEFHPTAPVLMTGSMDCMVRLYSIDGTTNRHLRTTHLPSHPIHSASFINAATELLATSRRPFLYTVNTETGQATKVGGVAGRGERSWERHVASVEGEWVALLGDKGVVSVLDAKSKQWVGQLVGSGGNVRAGVFTADGRQLYTVGDDDTTYLWDLRTRRCLDRRHDPASIHNTAIALSPPASSASTSGGLLAVGSTAGLVSLYPAAGGASMRTLSGLTTAVDSLLFNHSGELLVSSSRRVRDALSVYHVGSGSVVANWPTSRTPLHYVTSMDFSPHSGYLAVGNDRGRVLMYRLKHYAQM